MTKTESNESHLRHRYQLHPDAREPRQTTKDNKYEQGWPTDGPTDAYTEPPDLHEGMRAGRVTRDHVGLLLNAVRCCGDGLWAEHRDIWVPIAH